MRTAASSPRKRNWGARKSTGTLTEDGGAGRRGPGPPRRGAQVWTETAREEGGGTCAGRGEEKKRPAPAEKRQYLSPASSEAVWL